MKNITFISLLIISNTIIFAQEEKINSVGSDSISTEYIKGKTVKIDGRFDTNENWIERIL